MLPSVRRLRPVVYLSLLLPCFSLVSAQVPLKSNNDSATAQYRPAIPAPLDGPKIISRFVEEETRLRASLTQHAFKRDVTLQTIGPNGEVTGQYVRNSQFLFDDRGRRIERVLFRPPSTINAMRITKEDIQDLADGQLLGIDIVEASKYQLSFAGAEVIDSRQLFAIDVRPVNTPDPKRMRQRYFVGRVWIDPGTFQIVKIRGVVEPQGKQRFPVFETWREPVNDEFAFPVRTEADDVLHFPNGDVHYRIKVRYYDYKLFASKVTITEVDEPAVSSTPPPASKPTAKLEACVTNRNAPPLSPYHWPADTEVKVYLVRNMFTAEQRQNVLAAMDTWTHAGGGETLAGVKFVYAGESDGLVFCNNCLTIKRREVFKNDGRHYSFFNPLSSRGSVLISAWIDIDFATKDPKAIQGYVAHELGHGMGLWDCTSCKKKHTLMNGFTGINKDNGLIGPSRCDLETLKSVYFQERQLAAAKSNHAQKRQPAQPSSSSSTQSANAFSPVFNPRITTDGSPLMWWDFFLQR